MTFRYRFYCGLVDREYNAVDYMTYVRVIQGFVKGFTLYHTTGYWEGQAESSLTIEVIAETTDINPEAAAKALCDAGNQNAVLWTREEIDAHLVTR
jgi:hypothetical protein